MTQEQKEHLNNLFTRYGSPCTETEIMVRGYFIQPDNLDELERIAYYDQQASKIIQALYNKVEQLTAYRTALQERYNYLSTAPTLKIVKLKREKTYSGKVFYYLTTHNRNLLDGHEIQTSIQKYAGSDRHAAIADFKQYIKDHPGITSEMDIQKAKWEK